MARRRGLGGLIGRLRGDDRALREGLAHLAAGRHAAATAALADLTEALRRNRRDTYAFYNRGLALSALGRHAAALPDFAQTVAFNPVYAEGYLHLALSHAALGDRDAAATALHRALDLDPA